MNWQKISENSPKAFSEFHRENKFECSEEDFINMIQEHGSRITGIVMEDFYEYFDEKGIYVQIRCLNSYKPKLAVFQWKINDSGWSTEDFMCRKACETKAFEIAFSEREKQWENII